MIFKSLLHRINDERFLPDNEKIYNLVNLYGSQNKKLIDELLSVFYKKTKNIGALTQYDHNYRIVPVGVDPTGKEVRYESIEDNFLKSFLYLAQAGTQEDVKLVRDFIESAFDEVENQLFYSGFDAKEKIEKTDNEKALEAEADAIIEANNGLGEFLGTLDEKIKQEYLWMLHAFIYKNKNADPEKYGITKKADGTVETHTHPYTNKYCTVFYENEQQ